MRAKKYIPYLMIAGSLVLVACVTTPEQVKGLREILDGMVLKGEITKGQADLVIQALTGQGRGLWSVLTGWLADNVPTILTTLALILGWRGPITARKGKAPTG